MDRNGVMHEVLNATGGIYWIMQPYYKTGLLEDQHWAFLCVCLQRIEGACKEYCDLKQEQKED